MTLDDERPLARRTIATYAIGSLGTGGFATLPDRMTELLARIVEPV